MENKLLQHHTITDAFLPVNDEVTEKALSQAKIDMGESDWKKGYSQASRDKTRAILKEYGVQPETEISGKLSNIAFAETQSGKQTLKKLRVTLENDSGKTILSADLNKEFTQRLIAKLETAEKGQQVTIGSFAKVKERDGRTFVDHVATLKNAEGQDIPAVAGRFREAQDIANAAVEPLKAAGIDSQEVFTKTASAAREKYFEGVLKSLAEKYPEVAAEQKTQKQDYPRLDAHLKEPDGTWRSVGFFFVDKENQPRGVVAIENKETGLKERLPIQFTEKPYEHRDGTYLMGKVERADGSLLFVGLMPREVGKEQWINTTFTEKRGDDWVGIDGKGGTLKPNAAMKALTPEAAEKDSTLRYVKDKLGVDILRVQEPAKSKGIGL